MLVCFYSTFHVVVAGCHEVHKAGFQCWLWIDTSITFGLWAKTIYQSILYLRSRIWATIQHFLREAKKHKNRMLDVVKQQFERLCFLMMADTQPSSFKLMVTVHCADVQTGIPRVQQIEGSIACQERIHGTLSLCQLVQ